jgi:hypothetical protein
LDGFALPQNRIIRTLPRYRLDCLVSSSLRCRTIPSDLIRLSFSVICCNIHSLLDAMPMPSTRKPMKVDLDHVLCWLLPSSPVSGNSHARVRNQRDSPAATNELAPASLQCPNSWAEAAPVWCRLAFQEKLGEAAAGAGLLHDHEQVLQLTFSRARATPTSGLS